MDSSAGVACSPPLRAGVKLIDKLFSLCNPRGNVTPSQKALLTSKTCKNSQPGHASQLLPWPGCSMASHPDLFLDQLSSFEVEMFETSNARSRLLLRRVARQAAPHCGPKASRPKAIGSRFAPARARSRALTCAHAHARSRALMRAHARSRALARARARSRALAELARALVRSRVRALTRARARALTRARMRSHALTRAHARSRALM